MRNKNRNINTNSVSTVQTKDYVSILTLISFLTFTQLLLYYITGNITQFNTQKVISRSIYNLQFDTNYV